MKKFLNDILEKPQSISENVWLEIFKTPLTGIKESLVEQFIVVYHAATKIYSIQICYNTIKSNSNNSYLVFVFNKKDELILHFGITSNFPYVYNRTFLPYRDLVNIQTKINQILKDNKLPRIDFMGI